MLFLSILEAFSSGSHHSFSSHSPCFACLDFGAYFFRSYVMSYPSLLCFPSIHSSESLSDLACPYFVIGGDILNHLALGSWTIRNMINEPNNKVEFYF